MLLSILIVNYDTVGLLQQCLASIAKYPPACEHEIIIVNNGSNRDTRTQISALLEGILVVDLPHNVGFGRANNYGASFARGKYLLFLNSDTYYIDDSLDTLMGYAQAHPEYDFLGLQVKNVDLSEQESRFPAYPQRPLNYLAYLSLYDNAVFHRLLRSRLAKHPPADSYFLCGCHLLVKHSAYLETRGFDPDFFLYFEETEWFYNRILPGPYEVGVCPNARVVHIGKASQEPGQASVHFLLSRYLFFYKLHPLYFVLWSMVNLLNLLTLALCIPFVPEFREQNIQTVHNGWKAWKRAVLQVPRYSPRFASRKIPLTGPKVPWVEFGTEDITVIDERESGAHKV